MAEVVPYNSEVTPFVALIGVLSLTAVFLLVQLVRKFLVKRTPMLRDLSLIILCWLLGIGLYFIGLVTWAIVDERIWVYDISLPFAYSMIPLSTFFAIMFAFEFIEIKKKRKNILLGIYSVYLIALIISLFNFEANKWGTLPPIPDYRLFNLVALILGQIIVFSIIVVRFRKLIAKIEDSLYKKTLQFIWMYFFLSLMTFILMVTSEVHLMFVQNPPPYGPFEYLAWIVGVCALIAGYIGLTMPNWFKRRFKSE